MWWSGWLTTASEGRWYRGEPSVVLGSTHTTLPTIILWSGTQLPLWREVMTWYESRGNVRRVRVRSQSILGADVSIDEDYGAYRRAGECKMSDERDEGDEETETVSGSC